MKRDRIGILCGGGKAPGWPAGIKAATEVAEQHGLEPMGIEEGIAGLAVPKWVYRNIHEYGNQSDYLQSIRSPVYSSRYTPFSKRREGEADEAWDQRVLAEFAETDVGDIIRENLRRNRIKFLIALGGDDTIRTMRLLIRAGVVERNISPKTIDDDVTETLTFGHLTAGSVGRSVVEGIREEARTYSRIGIVESMGRYATWLAQQHHNADIILPAKEFQIERGRVVEQVKKVFRQNGVRERGNPNKGNAMIVVAEGFLIDGEETNISTAEDHHGHKRLGGVGHRLENWLEDEGFKTTYERPGYLYRFARPLQEDAELSYALAKMATEQAIAGHTGVCAVARGPNRKIYWRSLEKVHGGKSMTREEYDFDRLKPKSNTVKAE